jgi:hypothetical protein
VRVKLENCLIADGVEWVGGGAAFTAIVMLLASEIGLN